MEAGGLGPASLDPAQAEDDCSLVLLDNLEDTDMLHGDHERERS